MKKTILICLGIIISFASLYSQTYGHLNVSVSTSETGGNYAPRNIVAIWIEDADGNFVKTLMAYAQNRITHLNTWQASTSAAGVQYNVVDAITGPTRTSHSTRDCLWNGMDYNQNLMSDGTYFIWMELTDKNGTGNYSSFEFVKGEELQELYPENVPSFSSISIVWEPSGTGILENPSAQNYIISNNPGNGVYQIKGDSFTKVDVYSISGNYVNSFDQSQIDISAQPKGIYLFKIYQSGIQTIKKVVKR